MFPLWTIPFAVAVFLNGLSTIFEYLWYDFTGKDWNRLFKFFLERNALVPILCVVWGEEFFELFLIWSLGGANWALVYALVDVGLCAADLFYRLSKFEESDFL